MVYLDHNASTPLRQTARTEFERGLEYWANPGSIQHQHGANAESELTEARIRVARVLQVNEQDIIFTSGASEAAGLAIIGSLLRPSAGINIMVSDSEHSAVLEASKIAAKLAGGQVRQVKTMRNGTVNLDSFNAQLDGTVGVVAVMAVNNETGVINALPQLEKMAHRNGSVFVADATQAVGKISFAPSVLDNTIWFFSGHKIGGPKGSGVLVLPRFLQKGFVSLLPGGGQERGIRGGTQNLPAILGLTAALEHSIFELAAYERNTKKSVDSFLGLLDKEKVAYEIVSGGAPRISNTVNLRFPGTDADSVIANLVDVEVSTGSACNAANPEPSHVLLALGMNFKEASECIRFSFGPSHSFQDVKLATGNLVKAINAARDLNDTKDTP